MFDTYMHVYCQIYIPMPACMWAAVRVFANNYIKKVSEDNVRIKKIEKKIVDTNGIRSCNLES